MRTRNSLERLTAAGRPLLAEAETLVDASETDWILDRILASPQRAPRTRHRRIGLALAAAGVAVAAAAVASFALSGGGTPRTATKAQRHRGATFALAGYRFRLPAGYKASGASGACQFRMPPGQKPGTPVPVLHSFSEAAEARGGCLEALLTGAPQAGASPVPSDATPVAVGSYKGFLASRGSQQALYVAIPAASGDHYLVLLAQGMTTQQLVSIAASGLPSGTALPSATCTSGCG